jgi:hypothetical protein
LETSGDPEEKKDGNVIVLVKYFVHLTGLDPNLGLSLALPYTRRNTRRDKLFFALLAQSAEFLLMGCRRGSQSKRFAQIRDLFDSAAGQT